MGFWHTGYIEFHEPCGLDDDYVPAPPVYRCQHCAEIFSTPEALRQHGFEKHPFNRPVLLIRGIEVGSAPLQITRFFQSSDVSLLHCTSARLNGVAVSPAELGKRLAKAKNDTVILELTNEGVSASFNIRFEIASKSDIRGVEQCFLDVARRGRLDMRAVEDLISASHPFQSAIRYCDGVCDYFYGVLAKERHPDSSLPYEAYRDKFGRAADTLKDFRRPLADTIGALIAFHFNHFRESLSLAGRSRVGVAAARFDRWLQGDLDGARRMLSIEYDDKLEKLLTDFETERLLSWCVARRDALLPQWSDIDSLVRQDLPETDRAKLRILLAEGAVERGADVDARRHARELRSNPSLGAWAEHLLESLSKEG